MIPWVVIFYFIGFAKHFLKEKNKQTNEYKIIGNAGKHNSRDSTSIVEEPYFRSSHFFFENFPFGLMDWKYNTESWLSFGFLFSFALQCNLACLWGNFGLFCSLTRNCLAPTLDYIVMQMRKTNRVKGNWNVVLFAKQWKPTIVVLSFPYTRLWLSTQSLKNTVLEIIFLP